MAYRALPSIEECASRLELVFPRSAFDTVLSSPGAAAAVAAMLYVDAVVPDAPPAPNDARWVRPTTCLWLSEVAYTRADAASRTAYYQAAVGAKAKEKVAKLHASWGQAHVPLYGDNTRETLRDETFLGWATNGALRQRVGIRVTSPAPRWALSESFADLFDPKLKGELLLTAVEAWRDGHMTPGAKLKALTAQQREQTQHAIPVHLPNGTNRELEPGEASIILKGVIEIWAPLRLKDPVVLTISEPGDKIYLADAKTLNQLGLHIDQSALLPDALLVDIYPQPPIFWIIEAVATDGPITEHRKQALLDWAQTQHIPEADCEFLSAFASRNSGPARRRLKDLATRTFAWYADEPGSELAWYEL